MPAIAVVLPVHNGARYLSECINSVLRQDFDDFELIIGDDCSTDESAALIAEFTDDRIRYIPHPRQLGLFANLNHLLDEVRSPIIQFVCQDDVLERQCLRVVETFFREHDSVGWAFAKYTAIDLLGNELLRGALHDMPDVLDAQVCRQLFLYHGCIPGNLSSISVRTAHLRGHGGFDESFSVAGDFDLCLRLSDDGSLGVIHDHLLRVRSHVGQLSRASGSSPKFVREERRILRRLIDAIPPEIRHYGEYYVVSRWDVVHADRAIRLVAAGKTVWAFEIVRDMGPRHFVAGLTLWLLTLNNRFYRPNARFVYA